MTEKRTDLSEVTRIATSEDERVIYALQHASRVEIVEKSRGEGKAFSLIVELGGDVCDAQKHDSSAFTETEAEAVLAAASELLASLADEARAERAKESRRLADEEAERLAFEEAQRLLVKDDEVSGGR